MGTSLPDSDLPSSCLQVQLPGILRHRTHRRTVSVIQSTHQQNIHKMPINILSINANGLNHPAKRHSLWKTASALQSDILCVQETHLLASNASLCKNHYFPHIFHATHSTKARGVMIAVKNSVDFQLLNVTSDPEGRFIILICNINRVTYSIINLYAPNSHQLKFIRRVMRSAKPIQKGHVIICGDFNLVPDIHMDSTSPSKRRDSPLKKIHLFPRSL